MKRILCSVAFLLTIGLLSVPAANERGVAELTLSGSRVSIDYGRPEFPSRDLLALAHNGMVWRLGMNKATTLTSEIDLDFQGKLVRRGQYSLFAKKLGAKDWVLLVNSQTGLWGTTGYDAKNDVASIPLRSASLSPPIDKLTIVLVKASENQGDMAIQWGEKELRASFKIAE